MKYTDIIVVSKTPIWQIAEQVQQRPVDAAYDTGNE